ncbi:glycosyltransferase family 4 protein [uncultured Sulfitobacter sp.]|uniref:glycosyltransferase family 4 protein n=1 Tax=uncultured Sulfitobacter sp. TaxID=191468 RepID=UPI0030DB9B60|tara:strand:- start:72444 stop:73667 length:1224 start_codon:yes stop_codon:yes gene_type:complete
MHIIYFHQHFSTPQGATGIRSYEMARALLREGNKVTMVCGSYAAGETGLDGPFVKGCRRGVSDGIDIVEFDLSYQNGDRLLKRSYTFLKYALGSVKIALREPYDIAFATTTPLTAGIPGIVARWLRRKPFVFEVRDLWPELPREMGVIKNPIVLGMLSVLEWCSYRSAHRCVALSPGIATGIQKRGVKPEKIALVPNGCDIGIFNDDVTAPWRPEGVKDSDLMAVFTGTHGLANGLDAVLDVAEVLKRRGRDDIRLVLVGDGKLKSALMSRAERQHLDAVVFHSPVNKTRLAGLMASADLGLQCLANVPAFYFGTSPNKFFDYIAAGLPVLNNYPGWLAGIIKDNDCGFSVAPEDAEAFANALEYAADNPEALRVKGANAAALAKKEFDRANLSKIWVAWVIEGKVA